MKYAKVHVSNITNDVEVCREKVAFHHVTCDCTVEGGKTEAQVYRVFTPAEYESVMQHGYYKIPNLTWDKETGRLREVEGCERD